MKAPVSQILTENGRVTGVRVGNKESSAVDIFAPIVISDAGIESSCKFLISIVLGENERHGNKNEHIHNKSESIKSIIDSNFERVDNYHVVNIYFEIFIILLVRTENKNNY